MKGHFSNFTFSQNRRIDDGDLSTRGAIEAGEVGFCAAASEEAAAAAAATTAAAWRGCCRPTEGCCCGPSANYRGCCCVPTAGCCCSPTAGCCCGPTAEEAHQIRRCTIAAAAAAYRCCRCCISNPASAPQICSFRQIRSHGASGNFEEVNCNGVWIFSNIYSI